MSLLVRHAMTESPKTLTPEMSAADAAGLMAQYDCGVIPVATREGQLVGVITDRDIVTRVVAKRRDPNAVSLGDIATGTLTTVSPDTQLSDARELMSAQRIRRLPVVKDGALVGMLSMGDVAWADASARAVGETLKSVSESESTSELNDGPERGTPDRAQRGS